jgi:hypothetical protein
MRLLCDRVLGKTCSQFPSLVLGRMIHSVELVQLLPTEVFDLNNHGHFYMVVDGVLEQTLPTQQRYVSVVPRRRSSNAEKPLADFAIMLDDEAMPHHTDDAFAYHLQRLGYLVSIPRIILAELVLYAQLVSKRVGDVIVHENAHSTTLVLILHGFLSFYSIENVPAVVDKYKSSSSVLYLS